MELFLPSLIPVIIVLAFCGIILALLKESFHNSVDSLSEMHKSVTAHMQNTIDSQEDQIDRLLDRLMSRNITEFKENSDLEDNDLEDDDETTVDIEAAREDLMKDPDTTELQYPNPELEDDN